MARKKISIGNIQDVSGEIKISGSELYTGYTAEQVSLLLQQITSTFQPKPFDGRSPYKGLDIFQEEDAELFFGRERLTEHLVHRLEGSRAIFITGPAGSGTSSLVHAGLIHALKQGAISRLHSERWLYATMRPGREPMEELALVLSRIAGSSKAGEEILTNGASDAATLARICETALPEDRQGRMVLFVDQFHEIFTQVKKQAAREAFINLLTTAVAAQDGRFILLLAMRSDFVSSCAGYPALNGLLNENFAMVGAMQPEELVRAIVLPAKRVGLPVEDELVAQIINDTKGEPGALPLLQFALKDLFDSQQAKGGPIELKLQDYLAHGGIRSSLERHADHSFAELSEDQQRLARSIFSPLIEIGRGTQDTRRTAFFEELVPANTNPEEVQAVVQRLADDRLIITDEQAGRDTVTISHEKLIEAWPWLKHLVNENRELIALQNRISSDAKEWGDLQRDPSYLYRGTRLADARAKIRDGNLILGTAAQEFIEASEAWARKISLGGVIQEFFFRRNTKQQTELERKLKVLETKLAEMETQPLSKRSRIVQPAHQAMYKKFALIIGNTLYEDRHFAQLKTPEQDVMALVETLQDPAIGGFEQVQALVNQSSSDIEAAIGDFCADRGPNDLILLYFSGHGIVDSQGRLYLAAKNTVYERPKGRAIFSQFITDTMDDSRSKRQILILDCCHSGAFYRGAKGVTGQKAVTETTFEGKGFGRVVLTATDATQYAWENDRVIGEAVNSVFTHYLIHGLKSGAADMDNDGQITIDELYDYVYQQIVGNSIPQTPGRWIYRQQGKLFIASNPYFE